MRVAVIGASGRTGSRVVEQAVVRGLQVTAIVRDPTRYSVSDHGRVDVAVADVRDPASLEKGITGVDAVIFAVGPRGEGGLHVQGDGIDATLTAMQGARVKRIVAISGSWLANKSDSVVSRFLLKPLYRRALRPAFLDMCDMEQSLRKSSAEWTCIRPPILTSGSKQGPYRRRVDRDVPFGLTITRPTLAAAIVDVLADPTTIGHAIGVAR